MAFPSKTRGLRLITVNEAVFRWRFQASEWNSSLAVYGEASGAPLQVTLRGWQDCWIVFPTPTLNSPTQIGPAFTRRAIEFALQNGWQPAGKGAPFPIEWDGATFLLLASRNDD